MMRRFGLLIAWMAWALPATAADEVTFNKHVAPILWKNCAGCHRPGEVGPFSLLEYKDAAKRAEFLRDITASRRMPPWKPEPGYGEFRDARRLSDDEIQTIARWVASGAREGDPKDLPALPRFPEGWQLGEPDLVLKMPEPFTIPADGRDIHRCFVIPIPIDSDRTVAAFEFRPGNSRVVHHSILYLDSTGAARRKDRADGKPGYGTFGSPGIVPTGGLGAWAPGVRPYWLPDGVGKFLKKGSDLVLQIHYHPSGKEEKDQSMVGLFFTKKPAEKVVVGLATATRGLYIPAGAKRHVVTAENEPLPVDVQALAISPHMHLLGKEIKVTATQPDGKVVPLIWIKDWDFNWQGTYPYARPVRLPRGSVIKMEAVFDNSADNPRNPTHPPRVVTWGEQTTDEMCLCSVQLITDSRDDLKKVALMRGYRLGLSIDGGIPADELVGPEAYKLNAAFPPGGVPIPARYKDVLGAYDKDKDGKLSLEEVEAMPPVLRDRVREAVRMIGTLGGGEAPKK